MFEEFLPSLWASVNSWFTPSVLFVLVNIVIGTIAFTSMSLRGLDPHHPSEEEHYQPSVLQRIKSFRGLYRTASGQITTEQTLVESSKRDVSDATASEGVEDSTDETHVLKKVKSETESSTKKIASKLFRSVSSMSPIRFEEKLERQWPVTTRPSHPPEDAEVDAKADHFINNFRQQLKLQRLDSIKKYRDMFTRGK